MDRIKIMDRIMERITDRIMERIMVRIIIGKELLNLMGCGCRWEIF